MISKKVNITCFYRLRDSVCNQNGKLLISYRCQHHFPYRNHCLLRFFGGRLLEGAFIREGRLLQILTFGGFNREGRL